MEQLQNKLHSYTLFGLPKVPPQITFHQDSWEEEREINLSLEDSWQQLLDNPTVWRHPQPPQRHTYTRKHNVRTGLNTSSPTQLPGISSAFYTSPPHNPYIPAATSMSSTWPIVKAGSPNSLTTTPPKDHKCFSVFTAFAWVHVVLSKIASILPNGLSPSRRCLY